MEELIEREKLDYRPNVALVVLKNNKILVVLKQKGDVKFWYCPGGGVEKNETLEQGAKREFKEELGNDKFEISHVSDIKHKFEWPELLCKKKGFKGQDQSFVVINFLGNEGDIKPNKEIADFRFINSKELEKYIDKKEFLEKLKRF